ncbi:hypothetical protein QR680_006255 [Steinernema hermaphroditum]|uniref:Uncharacterized protein n=1 Tax=Steinernema hermaphroditum TaxID=289476 RepID=A0AA39HX56_9BILA|nr:hypothetical protein QR680_006255 [Steinernema hermaphroditum]
MLPKCEALGKRSGARFHLLILISALSFSFRLVLSLHSDSFFSHESGLFAGLRDDFTIRYDSNAFGDYRASINWTKFNIAIVPFLEGKTFEYGIIDLSDATSKIDCDSNVPFQRFLQRTKEIHTFYLQSMIEIWDSKELTTEFIFERIVKAQKMFTNFRNLPCLPRKIGKYVDEFWTETLKSGHPHIFQKCLQWMDHHYESKRLAAFLHELYVSKNSALRRACLLEIRDSDYGTLVGSMFALLLILFAIGVFFVILCHYCCVF